MTSLNANKNVILNHVKQHFKDPFGNHKKSFNQIKHKNDMELSKEF